MVVIVISNYMHGQTTCTLHHTSITTRAQGPGRQLSESTVLSRKNICCGGTATKNIFNLSKIFTASEPAAAQQPGPRGRLSESKSEKLEQHRTQQHTCSLALITLILVSTQSESGGLEESVVTVGAGSRSQHSGTQQLCCWY